MCSSWWKCISFILPEPGKNAFYEETGPHYRGKATTSVSSTPKVWYFLDFCWFCTSVWYFGAKHRVYGANRWEFYPNEATQIENVCFVMSSSSFLLVDMKTFTLSFLQPSEGSTTEHSAIKCGYSLTLNHLKLTPGCYKVIPYSTTCVTCMNIDIKLQ